jgi:hypothetical protein
MNRRRLIALVVATLLVAGCGVGMADARGGPCDRAGEPNDICVQAVALAETQLGWLHAPITGVTFRGSLCPPNARCAPALGGQGWVIFEFIAGDPVMVYVGPPDPVDDQSLDLVARPGEPPPEWLVEEMAAGR